MNKYLCILIMIVITYIPRMIPMVFMRKKITNNFIQSFLYYTPYAVLTSLSLPAMIYSTGSLVIGLIATSIAIILSYFRPKVYVVSIVAVLVAYILSFFL